MNRRDTLKTLVLSTSSLIVLPAWAKEWTSSELTAYPTSFSVADQEVMASVTDAIIPSGNSIGAASVGVDKFLQKLLDDCYEKDVQENVKTQLAGLETSAQSAYQKSFVSCSLSQRQELLTKLSQSENKNEKTFFDLMKSETIRGFNTSKEVMTTYLHYKVMPGHYRGCVDVKS
jgi:hypothetical protein